MTADEQTLRTQLAAVSARYHALATEAEQLLLGIRALRTALGALLSPYPVGTVLALTQQRRTQHYQVTHHEPRGFNNEVSVPYLVPLKKDGSLHNRGGRWLQTWDTFTVVSTPAQEAPTP